MKPLLAIALAFPLHGLFGCSSDSGGTTVSTANPCATRNATYLGQCVEQSGTCGALPDQVINVDKNGSTGSTQTCAKVSQDGCTARDTDCKRSANGCTISSTFQTTFQSDGSSASSIATISVSCSDGSSCVSTYQCQFTRQ